MPTSGRAARARHLALIAALAAGAPGAGAAELERAEIGFEGSTYHYTFVALLEGGGDAVHGVVTDYERLARINDDITASRVLERYPDGSFKRLLRLKSCVIGICFDLDFVERVTVSADAITTTIVPGEGNFRDGTAEWRIEPVGQGQTRMTVVATQTPKFWIPPVIGPWVLRRVFLREVQETCEKIEQLAAAVP